MVSAFQPRNALSSTPVPEYFEQWPHNATPRSLRETCARRLRCMGRGKHGVSPGFHGCCAHHPLAAPIPHVHSRPRMNTHTPTQRPCKWTKSCPPPFRHRPHMQRLMEHRAAVAAALRKNQRQRKRLRDDEWCRHKRPPPKAAVACALSMLVHGDGDTEAVREYARRRRLDEDALTDAAVHLYLATPLEGLAVPEQEMTQQQEQHVQRGRAFLAERRLSGWIRDLNETRGLAPSSSMVLAKAGSLGARAAPSAAAAAPTASTTKQWARRFRRRWRASVGTVKSHACGDTQQVQAKVAERRHSFSPDPARKNGTRSGTATRATFVAHAL